MSENIGKYIESNNELTKDERIKKEIKRLNGIYTKIEPKTRRLVTSLISNAAFMTISLEDLQEIINTKGYVEEYQNGANQFGVKKCSEVELYNTMVKNHMGIMKQLSELLPKEVIVKENEDGFEEFVKNGK